MPSPYPWQYSLRWPWYYRVPSTRAHVQLPKQPLRSVGQPSDCLKLVFCGDIMIMQNDIIPRLHDEIGAFMADADALIGNCESPLGTHRPNPTARYGIRFNMSQDYLANLIAQTQLPAHKWHLSIANNHTGDMGLAAALTTPQVMQDLGVTALGRWQAQQYPVQVVNFGAVKIGVVAWTDWMNCEVFSAADPVALRRQHIVTQPWAEIKKNLKLNYLIALPHWEFEFQHFPRQQTQQFAKSLFMQHDFDLVVGVHTHTLQPLQRFAGQHCFYNLGNFCGLGVAWPVRMAPLLKIFLNKTSGKMLGYEMKIFAQVNSEKKVEIVPLHAAPKKLRHQLQQRLNLLFTD